MKSKLLLAILALAPTLAWAQGLRFDSIAQTVSTVSGTSVTTPLPGATVTVCGIPLIAASPSGATESSNVVTITTTAVHGLSAGQSVIIQDVGVSGYNGTFTIATTPTASSFTYINGTTGLSGSGGGFVTPNTKPCTNTATIYLDPGLQTSATNPMTADSSGNFGFWGASTAYAYSISGAGVTAAGPFYITLGSGPGSLLLLSGSGVFSNGQINEEGVFLLNGLNPLTEYQASVGAAYSTNALIGGVTIPASSSVQSASGVAAFVNNGAGPSGTVGLATFSQCRDVVNGSRCWGGNLVAVDTAGLTSNVYLNGLEVDVQPQNVTGVYGGTGGIAGIDAFLISSQSGNYAGQGFGCYTGGSGKPQWGACFQANEGASTAAFVAGANGSTANSNAENFQMLMRDSGNVLRTATWDWLSSGFLRWTIPATGGAGWQFQEGANVVATINSTGGYQCLEGAASSGSAGSDVLYCDSASHRLKMNNNNGGAAQVVAAGLDISNADQVVATHLVLPLNGDSTTGGAARLSNNFAILTSDFTTANASGFQTITGLSFTLAANTAQNIPFTCELAYSQATNVSDSFGIQSATISPTRIDGFGYMNTSATVQAFGNLANLTSTTATAIVTATPTVATVNGVRMTGTIQNPSNASTNVINFAESQSTAADVVVIKAGSWCRLW